MPAVIYSVVNHEFLGTRLETDENYSYYFSLQDFADGFFRGVSRTLPNIYGGALALAKTFHHIG